MKPSCGVCGKPVKDDELRVYSRHTKTHYHARCAWERPQKEESK